MGTKPLLVTLRLAATGRTLTTSVAAACSAFALGTLISGYLNVASAADACPDAASLREIDRDGDGRGSRAEWDAWTGGTFDGFDLDRSGRVDQAEMNRALKIETGEARCGEGKCGEGRCGVRFVDADGDGHMSREEYIARHRRMFDAIDADGDGAISTEEACA